MALVPVVCAAALFFALRPFLGRRDWVIVALAGIVGFSWYLRDNALGYGWWLLSFVNVGESSPGQVPVTVLLSLGAVFAGIGGAVLGSSIAAQVPDAGSLFRRKKLVEDSITPKKGRESLKRRIAKNVPMREIPAIRGPYATRRAGNCRSRPRPSPSAWACGAGSSG